MINYPARGIGKTTQDKLEAVSLASDRSIWEIIINPGAVETGLNTGTQKKLYGFATLISRFISQLNDFSAYEFVITSYSIHYTKLYDSWESRLRCQAGYRAELPGRRRNRACRYPS